MSRASIVKMIVLALLVVAGFAAIASTVRAQQDFPAELARAQSMYYSARFQESIDLLKTLETGLANDSKRTADLLQVRLYLGLAHLGLNQTEQAKARFVEVCTLDGKFSLDPQEFSPKVIALFTESKASCAANQCVQVCARVDSLIKQGDLTGLKEQAKSADGQCACVNEGVSAMSKAGFTWGKDLYDKGLFAAALKEFNSVLALDEKHELAREYSILAQQRLQLLATQSFVDWRASFDARQFDKAAQAYEKIRADSQPEATKLATQIESEYNQVLSGLVNSWKSACSSGAREKLAAIRTEAVAVAANMPLGRTALDQMQQCNSRVCIQGDPALALTRLKTRVNPVFEPGLQRYVTRRIVVSIEIDESGNVSVRDVANANPRVASALKGAVEQWKFNPTMIGGEARCVETQLPINVIQPER